MTPPAPHHAPYGDAACDGLYHLLFADDLEGFRNLGGGLGATLNAELPDVGKLTAIAGDASAESRVRALAWRRLSGLSGVPGASLRPGEPPLLGVIVEVGLEEGLDVLAAYADGGVRYVNHAGGATIAEADPTLEPAVRALLAAAEPVARAIGPWRDARRPPGAGTLRLTFLVGGEIRFGEGPVEALAADPMGGPVFAAAGRLLAAVADRTVDRQPG